MPFIWNCEEVVNSKQITTYRDEKGEPILGRDGNPQWSPITMALANVTQSIGITRITKKNYKEFYRRMMTIDAVYGGSVNLFAEEYVETITPSLNDVKAHIGMWTNAPNKTLTKFREMVKERILEKAEGQPDHRWIWNREQRKQVSKEPIKKVKDYQAGFFNLLFVDMEKYGYDGLVKEQKDAITKLIIEAQ